MAMYCSLIILIWLMREWSWVVVFRVEWNGGLYI